MVKLIEHKETMLNYMDETFASGEDHIYGAGDSQNFDEYENWFKRKKQNHLGINLKDGYVPELLIFMLKMTR